jgi:hypothetical protein
MNNLYSLSGMPNYATGENTKPDGSIKLTDSVKYIKDPKTNEWSVIICDNKIVINGKHEELIRFTKVNNPNEELYVNLNSKEATFLVDREGKDISIFSTNLHFTDDEIDAIFDSIDYISNIMISGKPDVVKRLNKIIKGE